MWVREGGGKPEQQDPTDTLTDWLREHDRIWPKLCKGGLESFAKKKFPDRQEQGVGIIGISIAE